MLLSLPFLLLPLRATDVICACRWLRFLLLYFALPPSLILQADPSMSPPSRPLHKRREQTESSAQFFPIFPGCNRVLSLFLGPSGPRWCGWPARSSCYPMRHRFCRVAHVLMVDAARFGPVEHVGERPESLWYRNLFGLLSRDVNWSRSRSAVVLLSLPFKSWMVAARRQGPRQASIGP